MVASIKVSVGGDLYKNSLLCFCAALGIRKHPLGFLPAHVYTGLLAALVYILRLFFLEHCFEDTMRELHEVDMKLIHAFQEQHAKWLCVGTYFVFSKP
jgi:hypothetical protein